MEKSDTKALLRKKAALRDSARDHLMKNKLSKALNDYRTLYELDPTDLRSRLKIGDILLRMQKKEEALQEYQEVADKYAEDGYLIQAIAVYKLILRNDSSKKEVATRLADLYAQKGIVTPQEPTSGALPEIPLFSQLSKEAFIETIEKMKIHKYPEKGLIFKEGDRGDSICIISRGKVRIFRHDTKGNRIWLKDLEEGAFFGEFGYFANSRRHASVEALTEVECLEISKDEMEEIARKQPKVAEALFMFYKRRVLSTFLAFSPLFGSLSSDQRDDAFLDSFFRKTYDEDKMVINQGEKGDAFYMVQSGRLEVFREESGQRKSVAELRPGDFFGEIALVTDRPRMASVRAVKRSVLVYLKKEAFDEILAKNPEINARVRVLAEERLSEITPIVKASERETGLV